MASDQSILFQELESFKQSIVIAMGKAIEAQKQTQERCQIIENCFNESQWYLGEERGKKEQLENAFKELTAKCQNLEDQVNQLRQQLEAKQKELEDAQWYLGEERAKNRTSSLIQS